MLEDVQISLTGPSEASSESPAAPSPQASVGAGAAESPDQGSASAAEEPKETDACDSTPAASTEEGASTATAGVDGAESSDQGSAVAAEESKETDMACDPAPAAGAAEGASTATAGADSAESSDQVSTPAAEEPNEADASDSIALASTAQGEAAAESPEAVPEEDPPSVLAAISLSVDQEHFEEVVEPEYEEVWQVVGGSHRDGILVRLGCSLDSPLATQDDADGTPDRIATGSCVRQLEMQGTRLHYELLCGSGPPFGWVSTSTKDKKDLATKELLTKVSEPPGPGPCSMPATISRGLQMPYAPKIIWTYWDQGHKALPAFHKLCIESWRRKCPGWRVEVVDRETIFHFVQPEDLPQTFDEMSRRQHRADCARSALLYRHGGIYMDPSILAWRDVGHVVRYQDIERGAKDYAGFFRGSHRFVENWFMACRKGCEFIERWHRQHLQYWENRRSVDRRFKSDVFFKGVDFTYFADDETDYLVQHACLVKLMCMDKKFERMARTKTNLHDGTVAAFGGLWLNRTLLHRAQEKANQRRFQREIQHGGGGSIGSISLTKLAKALKTEKQQPGVMDKIDRLAYIEDVDEALALDLLWEESTKLVVEVDVRRVPFAKFTGPVTEQLRRLRLRDLLLWPSTLRRLMALSLGSEIELPSPAGARPPRTKGQPV